MHTQRRMRFTVASLALLLLFVALASFKITKVMIKANPCEITCQFSPSSGNLAYAGFSNCNGVTSTTNVVASTNYIPMLVGTGCNNVVISTRLPDPYPTGTLQVFKIGVLQVSHSIAADQLAVSFTDKIAASCNDYFSVTW
jgi:hypothetical protein